MIELSPLRIVLADDHTIVRMGFRLLIEGAGATVVAEADVTFVLFDSKQNRAVTIEGEIRALMDRLAAED